MTAALGFDGRDGEWLVSRIGCSVPNPSNSSSNTAFCDGAGGSSRRFSGCPGLDLDGRPGSIVDLDEMVTAAPDELLGRIFRGFGFTVSG